MVIKDIFKVGKGQPIKEVEFAEYAEKLVRLGVWDENIVAQEMRAVMNNLKEGVVRTEDELFDRIMKTLPTEKAARIYAGGDNLWKEFGFEFYKSDYATAFKTVADIEKYLLNHGKSCSAQGTYLHRSHRSQCRASEQGGEFGLQSRSPPRYGHWASYRLFNQHT
jgi:hypothetical protein